MVRRAEEVGVELCWGVRVEGLAEERPAGAGAGAGMLAGVHAGGELVEARFIAGADGLHSRVRPWAGLEVPAAAAAPGAATPPPALPARPRLAGPRPFPCRPCT